MAGPRRRWVVLATLGTSLLIVAILIGIAGHVPFPSDGLRARVIGAISSRLDGEAELAELTIRLFPRPRVKGTGLAIRHKGRRDVPPLISVDSFTVDADLVALWRKRVNRITLTGLQIRIPPRPEDGGDESGAGQQPPGGENDGPKAATAGAVHDFVANEVIANEATLTIIPRRPDKRPKVWQMHELRVRNVGVGQEMPFETILTNAVPPGRIDTGGAFGPWNAEDPGLTPLNGRFTFDRADLGYFKGISGILSAHGSYGGALGRIEVHGETDTPDFTVQVGGHPVPLRTRYHAIVDGTNGDTALEQIDATFLNTSLTARGGVFDVEGVSGRLVTLQVTIDEGRLEDVMRLAVSTERPPMTGALHLETKFDLPPGDRDVVEKLLLNGRFAIRDGRFTNPDVQKRIVELSRRASGQKEPPPSGSVDSDFSGRFSLGNGVLALPTVAFDVPGAAVRLSGRYNLRRETLAFAGDLFMDAKISETTTGWKSLLLKMVDPLFRRKGRTVIPIKISGTRSKPSFGLDVGRVFNRGGSEKRDPPKPTKP